MHRDEDNRDRDRAEDDFSDIITAKVNVRRAWGVIKLTPRVIRLAWRITPWHIALMLFLKSVTALSPVAHLWLAKLLIDSIIAITTQAAGAPESSFIFALVGAHALLALATGGLGQIQGYVQHYVGRRLSLYSDFLLRDKALTLDLAMLENSEFHDKFQRASKGAGSRPLSLINEVMKVVENLVTLVSLGTIFLALKWPITAILVITTIPNVYVMLKYSQKSYDAIRNRTHDSRWALYHATLMFMPTSFKEIKILQIGPKLLGMYKRFKQREFREDREILKKRQIASYLTSAAATAAYYGAYVYIVYETLNGNITVGGLSFFAGAFSRCQSSIKSLITVVPTTHDINVYIKDFFDLQHVEPELVKSSGAEPIRHPIQSIVFENVSFRYPRTESWVLRHINLSFKLGERIGLVGENGAGKTTFVKLLCRLYDPTEGTIYVNGVDLRDIDIEAWHAAIGVVFQDFVTYMGKIRDNIGYGQIDQLDNLPQIMAAARKGRADSFIQKLPEGYDTMMGREFARGTQLSGGQKQRLALARLFMRDADILILDEPTFALDPRTEYEIYETCHKHCNGKISLLISHRFSTMRIADRIIVLDKGQVLEDGSHEELMLVNGQYAELYRIQSKAVMRDANDETAVLSN